MQHIAATSDTPAVIPRANLSGDLMEFQPKAAPKKTPNHTSGFFVAPDGVAVEKAFKDGMEKIYAGVTELNAHSKTYYEAVSASAAAAAKGAESLATLSLRFFQTSLERQVEAARAFTDVRSVQEAIELHQVLAKTNFEACVAEVAQAAKTASAALQETVRPLSEHAVTLTKHLQPVR
jgi:phasin family protein